MIPMDMETFRRLDNIVLARAGVLGKPSTEWTDTERNLVNEEMRRMHGEYRDLVLWEIVSQKKESLDIAAAKGVDVRDSMRIDYTGNRKYFSREGHFESPLWDQTMPETLPGAAVADSVITPT